MTRRQSDKTAEKQNDHFQPLLPILLILILLGLYLSTLARTPVLGDPTEFTFIAHILGIAHPPGYVFITLVGKFFQTVIPFGSIAWRMHLVSAVSATTAALFVFATLRFLSDQAEMKAFSGLIALASALTAATAVNFWQHAIHTNPHIITATFLSANLLFLLKWAGQPSDPKFTPHASPTNDVSPSRINALSPKWLYLFCFSAGLGLTHHPLTVMAFPGYTLFILWKRPSILRDWPTLLKMISLALLGLLPWLYYPLRSPGVPFGPTSMNTLNGFLDHVLARGLSDSLPYFPIVEQPNRALVFWSLLRLQYSLPIIGLAVFGLLIPVSQWIMRRISFGATAPSSSRPAVRHASELLFAPALLALATFLPTYVFVISLRQQDIMAYLLGPMLLVGFLAGIGLLRLTSWLSNRWRNQKRPLLFLIVLLFFLFGAGRNVWRYLPHISLRHYTEAEDYVNAIDSRFVGSQAGATLLNDWERMTPIWYALYVNNWRPDEADVRLEYIAAGSNPWLEGIFNFLGGGPVYLSNFRQTELAGTAFRLRPAGIFYQVVEPCNPVEKPCDPTLPDDVEPVTAVAQEIEIVGFHLPEVQVSAGDFVPLTLAMRAPNGTADFYIPILTVGDIRYEFTTDSHLTTPMWQPGEIIIERFDFALPFDMMPGEYAVTAAIKNLSQNQTIPLNLTLGKLTVAASEQPVETAHLLANFRQRIGLVKAAVWQNGRRHAAPWPPDKSIKVQSGDTLNIILTWESLAVPEESYTVFVHLIDGNNRPYVALDYTPLGGSTPTHLWIPKWLPSQQFTDPYRLTIPNDLPTGTYFIEVGLYEFVGQRRLHMADKNGNLVGDRYILGPVEVER